MANVQNIVLNTNSNIFMPPMVYNMIFLLSRTFYYFE